MIDDTQWLDRASAQVLAFVARRLLAGPVLMVFAAREPVQDFRGLPELAIAGLRDDDAQDLLAQAVRWPLDDRVREQILAETRGIPLALLEFARGLSPIQLEGDLWRCTRRRSRGGSSRASCGSSTLSGPDQAAAGGGGGQAGR